jgi:hypothetical protein
MFRRTSRPQCLRWCQHKVSTLHFCTVQTNTGTKNPVLRPLLQGISPAGCRVQAMHVNHTESRQIEAAVCTPKVQDSRLLTKMHHNKLQCQIGV